MFSVSERTYETLWVVSRYLFVFLLFLVFVFALLWLLSDRKDRRERLRNLPGAGTVGELIVLSGGRNLAENTWFPVPREGILGSVRSCDLVIPCPGVRAQHLDFSWQDGVGLLLRPRSGCEVLVNGNPADCRTDSRSLPLTHGSLLQVGQAVLRLHLFAALDISPVRDQETDSPESAANAAGYVPEVILPDDAGIPVPYPAAQAKPPLETPGLDFVSPPSPVVLAKPAPPAAPREACPPQQSSWKEDWSE